MSRFNIAKGDRFKIAKSEGLNKIKVHLMWTKTEKVEDLDASTFLCGDEGVILNDEGFVYYNSENRQEPYDRAKFGAKSNWRKVVRPMSADGAVLGSIDNQEGGGEGETIDVNLEKVDPKVSEIVFVATIHEGDENGVTFGDVKDAYIAVVNAENDEELCRYELEAFTSETAVSVAKLILNEDGDWEFEPMGIGHTGGIETCIDIYAS